MTVQSKSAGCANVTHCDPLVYLNWHLLRTGGAPCWVALSISTAGHVWAGHSLTLKMAPSLRGSGPNPHLIHGSLGPPESTFQTASHSDQSFLHSSWQGVPILYNRPPLFLLKIASFHGGSGYSSNTWFFGPTQVTPKLHLDHFSHFCSAHNRNRPTDWQTACTCSEVKLPL